MGASHDKIRLRALARLPYADPGYVLRELRKIETDPSFQELPEQVRRLRTNSLNDEHEARIAALFAWGMTQYLGTPVVVAATESSDFDFVTACSVDDTTHYSMVQLKELAPEDLNPHASLDDVRRSIGKYSKTDTVLLVHLNRRGQIPITELSVGPHTFSEVWFIWCASADQNRWCLWSESLGAGAAFAFEYPT